MKHCPFKSLTTGSDGSEEFYRCHPDCALWVEYEAMCSFRLLADKVAEHRKRVRDAAAFRAMQTGEKP